MVRQTSPFEQAGQEQARLIAKFLQELDDFVPPDRAEALVKKWAARSESARRSPAALLEMAADCVLLSTDLLRSQPSLTGSTAIDRLARARRGAPPEELAAIEALRRARFRLLRVDNHALPNSVSVRDMTSGETLRLVGVDLPPLPGGLSLFARVASIGEGMICAAGEITPLDAGALAVATGHPAARSGGWRWAEAVYAHVVRHGTLEIPGLNREPDDDDEIVLDHADAAMFALGMRWAALAGAAPDGDLLRDTRQTCDIAGVGRALRAALADDDGLVDETGRLRDLAAAFERIVLVQLETVFHRERVGSGHLTLERIGQAVAARVAEGTLPPAARTLFARLRQQVAGTRGGRPGDDAELERLLQRIQGLRAKTVDRGCTEEEALAAAAKVAELLDRHGLSLGEVEFKAQPCEGIGIDTTRKRTGPIDGCVPSIGAFFDCRVWLERTPSNALRYMFFGLRGDVAAAHYTYEMVEQAFATETAAFQAGPLYRELAGERRTATSSFQIGLANGIVGKLKRLKESRDATLRSASGRDLVPLKTAMVDEEIDKLGLALQTKMIGGSRRVLRDPFAAGQAAGERFEVIPGITKAA